MIIKIIIGVACGILLAYLVLCASVAGAISNVESNSAIAEVNASFAAMCAAHPENASCK